MQKLLGQMRTTRVLLLLIGGGACGSSGNPTSPPPPPPPPPPTAIRAPVVVDVIDGANFGDGRDLSVTFRVQGDDSRVLEFRVFVAPSATLPSGDPPTSGPFQVVAKETGDVRASLLSSSMDIDGAPIEEGVAYVLYVQAWAGSAESSATSQTSSQITLARTNVVQTIAEIDAGTGGLAVDQAGNLYMADFGSQLSGGTGGDRVYRITPAGEVSVWATGFGGASGNAFDSQGNLFQSSITGNRISRVAPDGTVSAFVSQGLAGPVGIAISAGDTVFVANCSNNTLSKIAPDGSMSQFASGPLFSCPNGLALAADGNFYVANFGNGNLVRVSRDGTASTFVTLPTGNLGHVTAANGVLYVAARGAHQIYQVTLDGTSTLLAGTGSNGGRDGVALDATLSFTNDIALSPDGTILYFNDVAPSAPNTNVISPTIVRRILLDGNE